MTACENYLKKLLKIVGSVSVADFMNIALYHPEFGYYTTGNPLGDAADFVTSPEISQLFAEVLCLWAMEKYLDLGQPTRLALVELGPGRGLLMSDFLRFAQRLPDFHNALHIHLVEISPTLRALQQTNITHPHVTWHHHGEEAFQTIGDLPTLILANEFFDALPVNQYQVSQSRWQQRHVTLNAQDHLEFCFEECDEKLPFLTMPLTVWEENKIIEHNAKAEQMMATLVQHLKRASGVALIIDYGYLEGQGDSLQGVSRHHFVPVFETPGKIDLTAHVNFGRLQEMAESKGRVMTQRDFLFKYNLLSLAQNYGQKGDEIARRQIEQQVYKLTSSQEMGTLFKVLEVNFQTKEKEREKNA